MCKESCEKCIHYTIRDAGYYDREQHGPYCMFNREWLYNLSPCRDYETEEEEDPFDGDDEE